MIKQSFFIDVGEKVACMTVFSWISNRIDIRIRKRNKEEKKAKGEDE